LIVAEAQGVVGTIGQGIRIGAAPCVLTGGGDGKR
jgi:hypothetical protein